MDCQSSNCSPHFAHRYWYVGIAVLGSRARGDRRWHSLYSTANPTGGPGVLLLLPPHSTLLSFPTAAIVARAPGHDVLTEGSRNPGASNVYRLAGWKAGLIVFVGDFAKGAGPAGVGLGLRGRRGALL